jgi:hypothetical protein
MDLLLALPAPAKLNLFLHVTGRRADGYHTLQSVMQLVGLADWIDLERRADGAIVREGDLTGPAEMDLAVRAAKALKEAAYDALGRHDSRSQAHPGWQRSRRRLIRRGDHADRLEPSVGARMAPRARWPSLRGRSGPMCRSSFTASTPLPRASVRR